MLEWNFIWILVYKILRLRTKLHRKQKIDIPLHDAGKVLIKCRDKPAAVPNIQRKLKITVKCYNCKVFCLYYDSTARQYAVYRILLKKLKGTYPRRCGRVCAFLPAATLFKIEKL